MKRGRQGALYCRCGRVKIVANGFCGTCYTLKRQDEAYFGGFRETVLERDGHACRVCGASGRDKRSITVHHRENRPGEPWRSGRDKRSITVHHRVPGRSVLHLMIALCPGCHAKVHRTKAVLTQMPALLLELWREQHPNGHEQTVLDFASLPAASARVPLFPLKQETQPGSRA